MESGPSFSLGLTQFQSTSNETDISGFVPGNFNFKDVGFHENRSKYRNDLTIMKKLRDAASAKGKKTVVAISKKKRKEVVKRPITKGQEKIKAHPSIKEVNKSPSGISNSIADPINEEAPHEPSLMDFGEQTPPAEQTPLVVESVRESTQKINVSRGTYREQVLMKVDMNAIESLVKTYEGETEVKNDAFQHSIDNSINDISSPVSAIQSEELLQKKNLPDHIFPTDNIEVRNELQVSSTEISSNAFQKSIDNVIAGMYTPVVTMTVNSDDLSQKVNLPNPSLKTDNVEVPNEPQESTNDTSTDAFQESIDNIIAEISTPVVAMKMKFISPTEINDNELGDSLSTQDDYKRSCFVANNEESLINIIKGFNIPTALPWHLVNDVYFSVNCDEKFHWMRAVISVKKRCICMYDSMLSSHYREPSHEIKKLSVMLPTYLNDSGLLENTEQTVWSSLETYTDKIVKWLML
ncbi:hypothetical protein T459_09770 [Capsicum annuum]|uniref:Ubiquitin-like protease family profile domain-containing protein n=1 Tax=Capsicum annuum TaxID=4072 RepID=A0A2G3A0A3_CAPAN|nr:hypothetical protein T459_09770 [Capsicum annuum]